MVEPADHERRLFEQAVEEIGGATTSKIKHMKGEAAPKEPSGSRSVRRLNNRQRTVEPDHTVDLHGLEAKPALARLRQFLSDRRQATVVLIVHGKGRGILRRNVVGFLDQHPRVVEHLEAPPRLGGGGARLVRLK